MTNYTYKEKFRKLNKIIISILLILSITIHAGMKVEAYPIQGYVTGNTVNVRKGDSTSYASVAKLNKEHSVTVLEQSSKTSWYKIEFVLNGKTMQGWMSNQYIRLDVKYNEDAAFEEHLSKQKFPESYKPYLRDLHAVHPNWEFIALHTGLDWNTVIKNQANPVYRSLVPSSSIASWKSIDERAYDWNKGTWYNFEPGWAAASTEIVQYFMDPRNSLVSSGEV
ncbi:MAG TPA: SH3 domain-containing protein, partial [Clostridiales bacterium]|nr:SH3 domain-containing protein [Clostridiales bacterium]